MISVVFERQLPWPRVGSGCLAADNTGLPRRTLAAVGWKGKTSGLAWELSGICWRFSVLSCRPSYGIFLGKNFETFSGPFVTTFFTSPQTRYRWNIHSTRSITDRERGYHSSFREIECFRNSAHFVIKQNKVKQSILLGHSNSCLIKTKGNLCVISVTLGLIRELLKKGRLTSSVRRSQQTQKKRNRQRIHLDESQSQLQMESIYITTHIVSAVAADVVLKGSDKQLQSAKGFIS